MAGLCTLASVKLALMATGYSDTLDDVILQSYIDGFTDEVQEQTSRQFVADTSATDYYFDMSRIAKSLYVPNGIATLNSVAYATASQPASGGTYTTVPAANVLLRPLAADRRPGFPPDTVVIIDTDAVSAFYPGLNTVKINAICGFAAVPPSVERLAVANVVRRWQSRKSGQLDTIGTGDFGGPALRFMSADERALINRYTDPPAG